MVMNEGLSPLEGEGRPPGGLDNKLGLGEDEVVVPGAAIGDEERMGSSWLQKDYAELRAASLGKIDKITELANQLFGSKDEGGEGENEVGLSLEQQERLEGWIKSEKIPVEDLEASGEIVKWVERNFQQVKKLNDDINNQEFKVERKKDNVEQEREWNSEARGLAKIGVWWRNRRLNQEWAQLNQELVCLVTEKTRVREQLQVTEQSRNQVVDWQKKTFLDWTGEELRYIVSDHNTLLNRIFEDRSVLAEVQAKFLQLNLVPEMDEALKSGYTTEGKVQDFYQKLEQYLKVRDGQDIEIKDRTEKELRDGLRSGVWSYHWPTVEALFGCQDKQLVAQLVTNEVARSVLHLEAFIKEELNMFLGMSYDHPLREKVSHVFRGMYQFSRDESVRDTGLWPLTILDGEGLFSFDGGWKKQHDIELWQGLKSSPSLRVIWGETMDRIDEAGRAKLMKEALDDHDGSIIRNLAHYSDPKVIREMMILATTDNFGYRKLHSLAVINKWAKSPEWSEMLDEVMKQYPELEASREVLLKWEEAEYDVPPALAEAVYMGAITIMDSLEEDWELKCLAARVLSNDELLAYCLERNKLSQLESEVVKQGWETVAGAEERCHRLGEDMREMAADLSLTNEDASEQEKLFRKSMVRTAQLITSLREEINPALVFYVSQEEIREIWQRSDIEPGRAREWAWGMYKVQSDERIVLSGEEEVALGGVFYMDTENRPKAMGWLVGEMKSQTKQSLATLSPDAAELLDEKTWMPLMVTFLASQPGLVGVDPVDEKTRENLDTLFRKSEVKDYCLAQVRRLWSHYLNSGDTETLPFSLLVIPEMVRQMGGAGPLTQIGALCSLISQVKDSFEAESTDVGVKQNIVSGLRKIENRFDQENWSNVDRSMFYNITTDILKTSPVLLGEYLQLLELFNPSQLKQFGQKVYPLYQAYIALRYKLGEGEKLEEDQKWEMVEEMRREASEFRTQFLAQPKTAMEQERQRVLGKIALEFRQKFGIIKVPETFGDEQIRSIENVSRYLSNIKDRNEQKEAILGLYLALMINGQWGTLREGGPILAGEWLEPSKAEMVEDLLEARGNTDPLTAERLGMKPDQLRQFRQLLNQETSCIGFGEAETVEVKLSNLISNLKEIVDPDLYEREVDRQRLSLLLKWGNKRVGAVAAKMYLRYRDGSDLNILNGEEQELWQDMEQILRQVVVDGQVGADQVKELFQEGIKPLVMVVNLTELVKDAKVENKITELKELLIPSPDLAKAFRSLGEELETNSGVRSVPEDVSYLEGLVKMNRGGLGENDQTHLLAYLADVKKRVEELDQIQETVKNKFNSNAGSVAKSDNELLKARFEEIGKTINLRDDLMTITSIMTGDLNNLIENIRACLGCLNKEENNDTNTTIADGNKWLITSNSDITMRGSLADELVFLEPFTRQGEVKVELAFVMDVIYGVRKPIILENHIEVVMKKIDLIRERFPGVSLSVLVSEAAANGCYHDLEVLVKKLKEKELRASLEQVEVEVAPSVWGDHYIEFGRGAERNSGKKSVKGVLIRT
jgi:hypothetical protein